MPQPFPELCSKHLLVMEFLEGPKLVDGIRAQYSKLAALKGTTLEALEAERKEAIKRGDFTFQTLEQSKLEQWKTSWYLAVHDYLLNPANLYKLCYNYTPLVWWTGPYELHRTEAPVDLARVLELLCQVHANEIFEHGEHMNEVTWVEFFSEVATVVCNSCLSNLPLQDLTHYLTFPPLELQVLSTATRTPATSCC